MRTISSIIQCALNISLGSVFALTVHALPITGQANIVGTVSISGTAIAFVPDFTSTASSLETGSFAGLTNGTIKSLTAGPATGSLYVPELAIFSGGLSDPISFDLTYIAPGVGTAADCASSTPGAACTPPNSPFTLFQLTSRTVVASLQLSGIAYTGSSVSGSTPVTSLFSTTSSLQGTIPEIYQTLLSGGSLNGISFAAAFNTTPVPEPMNGLVFGIGLLGIGLVNRKSKLTKKHCEFADCTHRKV